MPANTTQLRWKTFSPQPEKQSDLSQKLGIHPVLAQVLLNRGIEDVPAARLFLSGNLGMLHDPFLLKGMKEAVARVQKAHEHKERVLIYGDYDVDGVTSAALLTRALERLGIQVVHHIPHRLNDGYGLNAEAAEIASHHEADLLISVDCGITSKEEVRCLNAAGIDVVIIDHHEPAGKELPDAFAVVNPKRHDCSYPFKHLAAVGLVAKFIQALSGEILSEDLELVVLGTVADVVPMLDENRIFVREGLTCLHQTKNPGLRALMEVSGISNKKMRPQSVGFILGPRINATGRMDTAYKALQLILTKDMAEAKSLADELDQLNRQRQNLQRSIFEEALGMIEQQVNFNEHRVIVLSREGWHKGVLGIVASKLSDMFFRPAIVVSLENGIGTASARSIDGFYLNDALAHCADILEGFGGHKFAAGLTLKEGRIEEFRNRINDFARKTIQPEDLLPTLDIDLQLPFSALSLDLIEELGRLEPFGEGNREPVFCSCGVTVNRPPQLCARDTIKLTLGQGKTSISAVGFGMAGHAEYLSPGQKIDVAYQLIIDDWNKSPTVQLKLKDIRLAQ